MSLLLRAVTGSCTEKRKVIFFMNINEQTVSRNLNNRKISTAIVTNKIRAILKVLTFCKKKNYDKTVRSFEKQIVLDDYKRS